MSYKRSGIRLVITLPQPLYEALKARAEAEQTHMSTIIHGLLRAYLAPQPAPGLDPEMVVQMLETYLGRGRQEG